MTCKHAALNLKAKISMVPHFVYVPTKRILSSNIIVYKNGRSTVNLIVCGGSKDSVSTSITAANDKTQLHITLYKAITII